VQEALVGERLEEGHDVGDLGLGDLLPVVSALGALAANA
jgi:hypothetical protein